MREIKFRGANREDGWVYGNLVLGRKVCPGENLDKPVYAYIAPFRDDGDVFPFLPKRVAQTTVGQFTGLHDKNGKEIYEGDILASSVFIRNYFVMWSDRYSAFGLHFKTKDGVEFHSILPFRSALIEVIGNIYDNPELVLHDNF